MTEAEGASAKEGSAKVDKVFCNVYALFEALLVFLTDPVWPGLFYKQPCS